MGLILFGVFLFLLIIGVPVAFSICTAAGVTVLSGLGQAKLLILIQRMFEACNSFSLIAVPFFILAGERDLRDPNLKGLCSRKGRR